MDNRISLKQKICLLRDLVNSIGMNKEAVKAIREIVSTVDTEVLGMSLPDSPIRHGNIYTANVYEGPQMSMSVFGMHRAGGVIPLHDHPENYGFIKVLRGRIRIRSFSFLNRKEEIELLGISDVNRQKDVMGWRPVYYDGDTVVNVGAAGVADSVCMLTSTSGNVHEVVADEDGSAFFDLLTPGYVPPLTCTYYDVVGDGSGDAAALQVGSLVWLRPIPPPATYFTTHLPYCGIREVAVPLL